MSGGVAGSNPAWSKTFDTTPPLEGGYADSFILWEQFTRLFFSGVRTSQTSRTLYAKHISLDILTMRKRFLEVSRSFLDAIANNLLHREDTRRYSDRFSANHSFSSVLVVLGSVLPSNHTQNKIFMTFFFFVFEHRFFGGKKTDEKCGIELDSLTDLLI